MKRGLVFLAVLGCVSCEKVNHPGSDTQTPAIIQTVGGQEMVLIPAGEFTMGSNRSQADEAPSHKVHLNAFLMDRTEVTQEMYEKLRLVNPSEIKGPKLPVHMMSWVLAARCCNERSKAEDLDPCYNEETAMCDFSRNGYRLPTEAEWEYASRAGGEGDLLFRSNPGQLRTHAWFVEKSAERPHPVAQKAPNAWGLYDMLGNVAEWCNDMYDKEYYQKSPPTDPPGPANGDKYVVRGGSYKSSSDALRPSARAADNPGFSDACLAPDTLGFSSRTKTPGTVIQLSSAFAGRDWFKVRKLRQDDLRAVIASGGDGPLQLVRSQAVEVCD